MVNYGFLYVPEAHSNRVSVIDCQKGCIIDSININDINTLPFGSRPAVLASTADGKKIYSDNFGVIPPTISCIDTATNTVKSIIISGVPLGMSISKDDKEIYIPLGDRTVEVFSTRNNDLMRKLTFHDVPVAAFSGIGNELYVSFASGEIGVFDRSNGTLLKPLIDTGGNLPAWFSFSKDGSKTYIAAVEKIYILDNKAWRIVDNISVSKYGDDENTPWAFTTTLSPDGNKLYVALLGASKVLVIDTMENKVINEIVTSGSATGITFNGDGTLGYISDMGKSLSFLKGVTGGATVANAWIGFGIMGNGKIITFNPKNDEIVSDPIITSPAPGISTWIAGKI
ncbi:YncE family protein [Serratia fonticola]|uniref:YncE family protein n=1 Tax=Serratia fonticola TaxID=47917 RepID=UPI003B00B9FE